MHAIDFLRQPPAAEPKPAYAVFGDDSYLRREALRVIKRRVLGPDPDELAIRHFAGDQASLADVLDELRTLPFLSPARLVIVDDADGFVSAHREELEAYINRPAETGVLVLAVKSWPSNTRLAKLVTKVGVPIECKNLAERELPGWLMHQAQDGLGVALDEQAARLLVELVGPEISLLVPELEKLAIYVAERGRIEPEDVARLVGAGRVETIWKTLDAATTGQMTDAIELLDRLLQSGEAPVGLLAAMTASLRKVYHAGRLRMAKRDIEQACREAGIPAYPAAIQTTQRQHRHLGPGRVDGLPALLLRADLDLKGSTSLTPRVVLERMLLQLARPRQEVSG